MIHLDINQEFAPENKRLSKALIISIEEAINENVPSIPDGEIAVAYISDAEIKRLNRMYRKKDRVTDVLSFSYLDQKHNHIGDVVISLAQAERQALEGDLQLELVDLIVHGVLHTLGYDHKEAADAEEMFPLQDKIVALVQ
ncbi:MAG: rRNA maturation RNase YbeY [Patescibacteria group bacterium]